jgi:MerR family transcriptional regulator, light-induced transcriptional regulator
MSNEMQWDALGRFDLGMERLKHFTEPLARNVESASENHLQDFATIIENVIVPRLLMAHLNPVDAQVAPSNRHPAIDIAAFVDLTMRDDPDVAVSYVAQMLNHGVQFQDVLLKLLAPAARELGDRWVHDSASFVEVTLGVARMHRILREFDGVPEHMWSQRGVGHHALLLPVPGEQHSFGLRLVQEFLLRESWTVTNHPVENVSELRAHLTQHSYHVIGLSLSGETLIDTLKSSIAEVRASSKNRHAKIVVGGHMFVEQPELVSSCGADAYAEDASAAVSLVNAWADRLELVE